MEAFEAGTDWRASPISQVYASRTELPAASLTETPAVAMRFSACHCNFVLLHWLASATKQHAAPRAQAPSSASWTPGASNEYALRKSLSAARAFAISAKPAAT